ncbi:MAG: hypothetical protein AB2L13_17945 [Spirochaetota bacterium]
METFKEEVFSDESSILNELPEAKLVVRVFFKVLPDNLRISIINNIAILEEELVKVESRVKKAYSYKDISDAFDDVLDDSGGSGPRAHHGADPV